MAGVHFDRPRPKPLKWASLGKLFSLLRCETPCWSQDASVIGALLLVDALVPDFLRPRHACVLWPLCAEAGHKAEEYVFICCCKCTCIIGLDLQVVPALDPATPVFCGPFVMKLVTRRMKEFSLFDESRFREFKMNETFQAGPFE